MAVSGCNASQHAALRRSSLAQPSGDHPAQTSPNCITPSTNWNGDGDAWGGLVPVVLAVLAFSIVSLSCALPSFSFSRINSKDLLGPLGPAASLLPLDGIGGGCWPGVARERSPPKRLRSNSITVPFIHISPFRFPAQESCDPLARVPGHRTSGEPIGSGRAASHREAGDGFAL